MRVAPGEPRSSIEDAPEGLQVTIPAARSFGAVSRRLDARPRQPLGWMKPSEVFARNIASTGRDRRPRPG